MRPLLTLVADDSHDDQVLLCHFLKEVRQVKLIGFVQDGFEAVSYLRGEGGFRDRRKFPYPDLLLLDYQMPRLNGMEVMAVLQAERIKTQIVFWTSVVEQLDQELAMQLGASVVCRKPMNDREMNAIFQRLQEPSSSSMPSSTAAEFVAIQALRA